MTPARGHRRTTPPQGLFGLFRNNAAPIVIAIVLLTAAIVRLRTEAHRESARAAATAAVVGCSDAAGAYGHRRSHVWLTISAPVSRLLPDADGRLRHQRFIVRCPSGLHVLIVNDVSIGERAPVRLGESVAAHGEYVWNDLGGLVHFTHHSQGGSQNGWILAAGRVYQ